MGLGHRVRSEDAGKQPASHAFQKCRENRRVIGGIYLYRKARAKGKIVHAGISNHKCYGSYAHAYSHTPPLGSDAHLSYLITGKSGASLKELSGVAWGSNPIQVHAAILSQPVLAKLPGAFVRGRDSCLALAAEFWSGREIGRTFGHQQLSSGLWGKVIFSFLDTIMVRRCSDTDLGIVRVPGELARPKWFERGLRVCVCVGWWVRVCMCVVLCCSIVLYNLGGDYVLSEIAPSSVYQRAIGSCFDRAGDKSLVKLSCYFCLSPLFVLAIAKWMVGVSLTIEFGPPYASC